MAIIIENGSVLLEAAKKSEVSLRDILSVVPAAIATMVCLVGFVALNILHYHYSSIFFAIGALSGAYTLYQAYQFQQLESLQQNNAKFSTAVTFFQKEIKILKEQIDNAENMVSAYGRENQTLNVNVRSQSIENQNLKVNIEKLNQEISALNNINATLEQNLHNQINHLQTVSTSLKEVEWAVFSNHRVFGEKVAIFSENVNALRSASGQIDSSVEIYNKQFEQTTELALLVGKIFQEFEQWKHPESTEYKLNLYQHLQEKVWEMQRLIAVNESQAKMTTENLDRLKATRAQFEAGFDILKQEVEKMNRVVEQKKLVIDGVRKLTSEIKELPPGAVLPQSLIDLIKSLAD